MGRSPAEYKELGVAVTTKHFFVPVNPEFIDPEHAIIGDCIQALECLDPDASFRVSKYLFDRFRERLLDSQWEEDDIAEPTE